MPKYYFLYTLFVLIVFSYPVRANDYPYPSQGKSGLFGYVDSGGNFVIKPQFEKALPFSEGMARVMVRQQWRLINEKGKFLSREIYAEIGEFRNGVALIARKSAKDADQLVYGLLDGKGREIVEPYYHYFTPNLNHTLFIAGRKDKADTKTNEFSVRFGLLNAAGKEIIPVRFSAIRDHNFRVFAVKNAQEHWQVYTAQGLAVFPGSHSDIKDFDEDMATVKQLGKWGVIARNGNVVVKPVYKDVIKKGKNAYDLVSFVQWKVVNARKETLLNLEYDHLQPVMNSLYSYMTAGKYGLLNDTGQPLTAAIYDEINTFVKDLSVVRSGDRYGVITTTGREALPVQYEAVVIDSSGAYIKARQDGQWGVFSKSGKALTALIYDDIRVQPYGLFNVRAGQLWYLLDASGHVFGSSSYEHLGDFSELYAVARSRGRAGVINSRGSWVLEPAYDSIRVIDSRVACFYSDGYCGLVNLFNKQVMVSAEQILPLTRELFRIRSGEKVGIWHNKGYEVIPAKYDFISNPGKDSLLSVYIEEKKGLINLQGKIILKPQSLYQELHVMEEERVGVRINNKYGFVDRDGKLRIANRYDGIGAFSEGMAAIKLRGGWGFVDMREELRVQPIYEEVLPFKNGIAPVKRNGGWGFINRRGEELIKPRYDAVERLTTGRYLVSKDGKKGLVSETGKEVYVPKYDEVNDLCNGYIRLTRNEKAGLSDVNGFDIFPIVYDYFYYTPEKELYVVGINPPVQNFVYSR